MCTGQAELRTDRLHRSREPETHAQNGEARRADSRRPVATGATRAAGGVRPPRDTDRCAPSAVDESSRLSRLSDPRTAQCGVERGPRGKSGTGPPSLPPPGDAAPRKTKAFQRSPQRGERPVARGGRALHRPSLFCRQRARSPRATNQTLALSAKPSVETAQQSKSASRSARPIKVLTPTFTAALSTHNRPSLLPSSPKLSP